MTLDLVLDIFGFPNAGKTILIVKGTENLPKARVLFGKTGVKISTEGERHLGAALGSDSFKDQYVSNKVDGWVSDIGELALIAKEEPQLPNWPIMPLTPRGCAIAGHTCRELLRG